MLAAYHKSASTILLMFSLMGCSFHYIDNSGNEKIIGLSMLTLAQHKCTLSTTVRSFGLTLDTTHNSGGLNLGYKTFSSIYLKNDESGSLDSSGTLLLRINHSNSADLIESTCQFSSPAARMETSLNGKSPRS